MAAEYGKEGERMRLVSFREAEVIQESWLASEEVGALMWSTMRTE